MKQQPLDSTAPKISVDGLEHVFVEVIDSHVIEGTPGTDPGARGASLQECPEGIPVEDAARRLGTSTRAIIKRLQKGTLKGYKVSSKFGNKWIVDSEGIPGKNQGIPKASLQECPEGTPGQTQGVPSAYHAPESARQLPDTDRLLWQLLQEKDAKLEALIMRNGYLQAQLENHKDQIKLLTDSQHKGKWWTKVAIWFFGK